jgi:hypothetical protein
MSQISHRLKELIFFKLNEDLKKFIIHPYGNDIWLLDKESKTWFLQIESKGDLWYNQKYFNNFFLLFSLGSTEYSKILKEWTEKVLEVRLKSSSRKNTNYDYLIENIIFEKTEENIWDGKKRFGFSYNTVKKYSEFKNKSKSKSVQLDEYLQIY